MTCLSLEFSLHVFSSLWRRGGLQRLSGCLKGRGRELGKMSGTRDISRHSLVYFWLKEQTMTDTYSSPA